MANNDYQLEELENAAVKKSNNAKRIAAAAGLLATGGAAGGAAGYAATPQRPNVDMDEVDELSTEEMDGTLETAANQVHEPEPTPQPHSGHNPHKPQPAKDDDVDVSFNKSTNYYDEDGNLVMVSEEGKVNGHDFTIVDADADGKGDLLAIDANGNGVYEDDEIYALTGSEQIDMGNATHYHEDVYLANNTPEPEHVEPYDIYEEKDMAQDTHKNMADEKEGEVYGSENTMEEEEDYYVAQQETEDTTSYDDLGPDMDFV